MRQILFAFILLCCAGTSLAQGSDSVVRYRTIEAALTASSQQTPNKNRFEVQVLPMKKDDMVYVKYTSRDFIVALAIKDASGHISMEQDKPLMFESLGSSVTMSFKATEAGNYTLIFLSKEPEKTGKFKVELLYYSAAAERVTTASSFCDKLKYIAAMAYTQFEFMKGASKPSYMNKKYNATIALQPDAVNDVSAGLLNTYSSAFAAGTDLDALKKQYDQLETQIRSCLSDHTRKEYTVETVASFEKKDFVRKVEYKLPGKHPDDQNTTHGLNGCIDKVTLKLERSGTDKYVLKLEIE